MTAGNWKSETGNSSWLGRDWIVAGVLFLATAAVVLWQNSRLAVLWDLSYILETSHRIALGDIPYRDFPLPYAPLTFVTQAALIKLTGRVFFHHVLYCAVVGGLGTVVTWRILLRIFSELASARMLALLLALPLTVLGIYSIFPHPFYDCDCTFAMLLGLLLLYQAEAGGFRPLCTFFSGAMLAVPLFIKQNTGLAFVGCALLALAGLAALQVWRRRRELGCAWAILGALTAFALGLAIIHFTAGLANYEHWTIQFAASRRMPSVTDMLAMYRNRPLPGWIAGFAAGAILMRFGRDRRLWAWVSASLMAMPFVGAFVYLFLERDASERAERLLAVWPFLLLVSPLLALGGVRRRSGIALVMPFVLIGSIHGALLSQQLWGSTYAIWPLFVLLAASSLAPYAAELGLPMVEPVPAARGGSTELKPGTPTDGSLLLPGGLRHRFFSAGSLLVVLTALSLTTAGGCYVHNHERLDYANLSDGPLVHATLPALAGLAMRGPWIPQFEELVRFSEHAIPTGEGILMLPGEDLFYYTTGRRPRFPVLMFDHTVNPYGPEQIAALARSHEIRWLVVKRDLQLEEQPMQDQDRLLQLLLQDFQPFESLDNYDIYRRREQNPVIP
jgi:hypothetical protein